MHHCSDGRHPGARGSGRRGTEGKIAAIRFAREEQRLPYLGICLGMQFGGGGNLRGMLPVWNITHSTRIREDTPYPVVGLITEVEGSHRQKSSKKRSGDFRPGWNRRAWWADLPAHGRFAGAKVYGADETTRTPSPSL